MRKILFALLSAAAFAATGAQLDINGNFEKINTKTQRPANWYFNSWKFYKPLPKVEVLTEETGKVLHILDIQAPRGTELYYAKAFPAVAGDTVTVTASVKGSGSIIFGIQYRDEKNNYISYTKRNGSRKLTGDWKDVKVTFKVGNAPKAPTKNIYVTISANTGNEIFIRNLTAELTTAAAPAEAKTEENK